MTLPDERYRAVLQTRDFLLDLISQGEVLKVPLKTQEQARACLRHYPSEYEMKLAAEAAPGIFQERMEPLYRMIKKYDQDKSS